MESTGSKEDFNITFASNVNENGEEVAILTSEEMAKSWMEEALKSFDPSNRQYSVYLNEQSGSDTEITIADLKKLAKNAQNDLTKILKINSLVRQEINEDDIIGKVYESIVSNLNANVRISFDNLPQKYKKKTKDEAEKLIKRFHKETNMNHILSSSIPTVYTEGNSVKYLRSKNGHYVIDVNGTTTKDYQNYLDFLDFLELQVHQDYFLRFHLKSHQCLQNQGYLIGSCHEWKSLR